MSQLRCWPGCVARITKDSDFPANVGAIVEVIGPPDPLEYNLSGEEWEVLPISRPLAGFDVQTGQLVCDMGEYATYDRDMTPITPPPGAETTSTSAPLTTKEPA